MNKFLEISKSWIASINPSEEQQKRADQRIAACNDCSFRTYSDIGNFYYCSVCGCPLAGKVYSPIEKSCPKDKWEV
jgi:hypothetical protein